jgi:DNA-binding HxlR family transcriptional regulator
MPSISQRMLTLDLRALEKAGIVQRTIYPEIPPRVEYDLTAEGQRLRELVDLLGKVGTRLANVPQCAPVRKDAAQDISRHV